MDIPPEATTPKLFEGVLKLALRSYHDRPPEVQMVVEKLCMQMHVACPDLSADQLGRAVTAASVVLASPQARDSEEGQALLQALSLLGGALLQEASDG